VRSLRSLECRWGPFLYRSFVRSPVSAGLTQAHSFMRYSQNHISDHDLLRSADGELTAREAAEIESHLPACWTCRARKAHMETAIADFVNLHHNRLDAMLPSPNSARANLKRRMLELSQEAAPRKRWLLFLSTPNRFQFALACAILGLLALAIVILQVRRMKYGHGSALAGMEAGAVPDSRLTPGATLPVTSKDVCAAGVVDTVRVVPEPVARRVFASYGIYEPKPRAYELDYLITPALGGGDDIRNFWPGRR
jgi:hypothetical protein